MTTKMTLPEAMAVAQGMHLFCYRPRYAQDWRSCFYDPRKNPDPKRWLETHNIPIAEIDMTPSQQPPDVSDEAWKLELRRRHKQPVRWEEHID